MVAILVDPSNGTAADKGTDDGVVLAGAPNEKVGNIVDNE
jgi:hypothetical protein